MHRRAEHIRGLQCQGEEHTLARVGWFASWKRQCFMENLASGDREVQRKVLAAAREDDWVASQDGWQRRVTNLQRDSAGTPALLHLRRRLDRWPAATLPGHRLQRAQRRLQWMAARCAPRVVAAYLRLLCDGWCTKRRFQGRGPCHFGCGSNPDSIEHYAVCPVIARLLGREAEIVPRVPQRALDEFLAGPRRPRRAEGGRCTPSIVSLMPGGTDT